MKISGLVITYNEEKNIAKCVKALFKVCDEVIVVDSFSTDNTLKLAEVEGAKVFSQTFLGDGPQRTFGLQFCRNNWILNLDADEFLDTDAVDFCLNEGNFIGGVYDGYSFRVKNYLGEKELIDYAGWYPDYKVRLFNRLTAKPSEEIVHQTIQTTNEKKVPVHILHFGWSSLDHLIQKKNQYSTWHAQQLYDRGKKVHFTKPVINGIVAFAKSYFFKKGFLNGLHGLTFSLIQSFFSYLKYAKLRRLQQNK